MSVSVSDILDWLVARSAAPSTFGAQLDRLKYGTHSAPDPHRAMADAEDEMMRKAVILRCISTFEAREEFSVNSRQWRSVGAGFKVLTKLHDATKGRYPQGVIAINILRMYHEWCTCSKGQSPERGLVAVYQYIRSVAPDEVPPPPKDTDNLEHSFRIGTAKRARAMAAEAYADALLALQDTVRTFNKREEKKA